MSPKSNSRLFSGQNFNHCPGPGINPTNSSPDIIVIGGGVTGLVTAWVLLDHGYPVIIVAKERPFYTKQQRLTSKIAGHVGISACGQPTDNISLSKSKRWCMVAYRVCKVSSRD
jgi:D-amino-acid oxidase